MGKISSLLGVFSSLSKSNSKKEALQSLEIAQSEYESIGKEANMAVQQLYSLRKKAVHRIEDITSILEKQSDFGSDNFREIAEARASIRLFTEAMQNEKMAQDLTNTPIEKGHSNNISAEAVGVGSVAAGAAVATMGPTAAMAIATTFGTAATGTAISTLSGAAATNAALAWLGGGALAVGGGGIAAGTAILAMAGPVGFTIGAIGIGIARSKNNAVAQKAEETTRNLRMKISKLKNSIKEINSLHDRIIMELDDLEECCEKLHSDGQDVKVQERTAKIIQSLCNNINKKFTV